MEKKRKKSKIIRHVLDTDCKECIRRRNLNNPLVRVMKDADRITLVNLNNSLEYLRKMTDVSRTNIARILGESGNDELAVIMTDYFTDVAHCLDILIRMKDLNVK